MSNSYQFYDDMAAQYDTLMEANAFYSNQNRLEAELIESFVAPASDDLCAVDIGCGTGEHTKLLLDKGYRVMAVDPSEAMLNIARRKLRQYGEQVSFSCCSAEHLGTLRSSGCDVLISTGSVLNHLDDWGSFFREASRVLRPSSTLIFSVDNSIGLDSFVWPFQECIQMRQLKPLARIMKDMRASLRAESLTNEWPYIINGQRWQQHLRYYSWSWICRTLQANGLKAKRYGGANVLTPLIPSMMRSASNLGNPVSPRSVLARLLALSDRLLEHPGWRIAASIGIVCEKLAGDDAKVSHAR